MNLGLRATHRLWSASTKQKYSIHHQPPPLSKIMSYRSVLKNTGSYTFHDVTGQSNIQGLHLESCCSPLSIVTTVNYMCSSSLTAGVHEQCFQLRGSTNVQYISNKTVKNKILQKLQEY